MKILKKKIVCRNISVTTANDLITVNLDMMHNGPELLLEDNSYVIFENIDVYNKVYYDITDYDNTNDFKISLILKFSDKYLADDAVKFKYSNLNVTDIFEFSFNDIGKMYLFEGNM